MPQEDTDQVVVGPWDEEGSVTDPTLRECIVCLVAHCVTRFGPCQHSACCGACAASLLSMSVPQCPLCSTPIKRVAAVKPWEAAYVKQPQRTKALFSGAEEAAWRGALTVTASE